MAQHISSKMVIYPANVPGLKKNWTYTTGDAIESSPAATREVVYTGSADHTLYAFDIDSDDILWRYETEGGIQSSPAIANRVVYVGSNDHNLYAFIQVHVM